MNRAVNTQAFLDRCRDIVLNSAAMIESRRNMDSAVTACMNQVLNSCLQSKSSPQLETSFSHLLLALRDLIREAERQIQLSTSAHSNYTIGAYVCPREQSVQRRAGASSYDIPRQQLQFLYNSGFTVTRIARLLHVSLSTVRRRLRLMLCALRHE